MKKYTFRDWMEGKVILKYDYIIAAGEKVIPVGWEQFNDEDILLIKTEQKKVFDEKVNVVLEKFKSQFNKELEASLESEGHRIATIGQIDDIFKKEIPSLEFISTDYWNRVFSFVELTEIQQCYKNNISKGVKFDYNFIFSPQKDNKWINGSPKIYAYALFIFRNWVMNLKYKKTETKADKLKIVLGNHGFFELPRVKQLSEPQKHNLIELINTNGLPYAIAMFDYLDFFKHIEREYFKTKYELNRAVAKWFNSDKEGRSVKGNISTLLRNSTENKSKYTAHTHKQTVIKDYQKLK